MPPKKKEILAPVSFKWGNEESLDLNKKSSKKLKEEIESNKAKTIYVFVLRCPNLLGKKYLIEDKNIVRDKVHSSFLSIIEMIKTSKPNFSGDKGIFHRNLLAWESVSQDFLFIFSGTEKEIKNGVKKILNEEVVNKVNIERTKNKLMKKTKDIDPSSLLTYDILIVDIENLPSLDKEEYKHIPASLENLENKFKTQLDFQLITQ